MKDDPVGSGLLAESGGVNGIGEVLLPGVAEGADVVDVDEQVDHREASSGSRKNEEQAAVASSRSSNAPYGMNPGEPRIVFGRFSAGSRCDDPGRGRQEGERPVGKKRLRGTGSKPVAAVSNRAYCARSRGGEPSGS
jgi:hypothetical protein